MPELTCGTTVTYSTQEYKDYKQKLKVIAKLNGWSRSSYSSERYTLRYDDSCSVPPYFWSLVDLSQRIEHCVTCKKHCYMDLDWI